MILLIALLALPIIANAQLDTLNSQDLQLMKNHTGKLVIQLDRSLGLQYKTASNGKVYFENADIANCTAVIVSKTQILTSAHCTELLNSAQVLKKTYFVISNHMDPNLRSQKFSISNFRNSNLYSKYNKLSEKNILFRYIFKDKLIQNDLALLETTTELPYNNTIRIPKTDNENPNLITYSFNNGTLENAKGSFKMCSLLENKKLIKTSCIQEITRGNSGGPLFTKISGEVFVIGITSTRVSPLFGQDTSYYFTKLTKDSIVRLGLEVSYPSQIPLTL